MAQVLKVQLVIVTDVGEYTVETVHPTPGGGNPAFVTAQLASAIEVLGRRGARILEAEFGPQHESEAARTGALVRPKRPPVIR